MRDHLANNWLGKRQRRTSTALNSSNRVAEHFRTEISEEPGRSGVITGRVRKHRGCTGTPVATWRDTKQAYESFREVGLRGEATLKRDVGYRRLIGSEKLLR